MNQIWFHLEPIWSSHQPCLNEANEFYESRWPVLCTQAMTTPTPKQKKQLSNTVELDLIRKPTTSGKQKNKGSKNLGFVSLLSVFLSRSNSWVLILFDGFGSLEISMMHAILSICVAHMLQLLLCKIGSRNWCVYGCGVTVIQSGPIRRKNSKYFGQG